MIFGYPTDLQLREISYAVRHRHVWDFGCGNEIWPLWLLELGANSVVGVDKHEVTALGKPNERLAFMQVQFQDLAKIPRVATPFSAFVSWPSNVLRPNGLGDCIAQADQVIYLGNTFGGTSCGSPCFWKEVRHRPVTTYVRNRKNSLIIFGKGNIVRRALREEVAATTEEIMDFEER